MYKFIKGWAKVVLACTSAAPAYMLGYWRCATSGSIDKGAKILIKTWDNWKTRVDPAVKELNNDL